MIIYLVSAAGYPNYGDELILKNWVNYLLEKFRDAEIWIDVPFPTNVAFYFPLRNIRVTNVLWRLVTESNFDDIEGYMSNVCQKIKHLGSPRFDEALIKLRDVNVIHIVGGGYINRIWRRNIGILCAAAALKELINCRIYMTGAGLYPPVAPVDFINNIVGNFDYVEVRDEKSANGLNVNLGYDDAYLSLNTPQTGFAGREIPSIMVCIQRDQVDDVFFYRAVKAVEERIKRYRTKHVSVGYVEAIPGEDRAAYMMLADYIPDKFFFNAMDTINHGLPLKRTQRWYTTRFHHHLVASMNGCEGVALVGNGDYYDVKHSSLISNGTGWSLWNANCVTKLPFPSLSSSFSELASDIILSKHSIAESLYEDALLELTHDN
ncbi:polysaccharide pyruvyl transferase family protein [Brucella intermedia]|uniref:polysaccharide pyruvyl transferase family protein n=1 Tax=Brucella intermedia TaxID=94625 RepID=UPI002735078D|nr:polysaccharide pyruvyl transferase family protein [Brucella intermedia]WLF97122.1 polysaccharide pyruvyl transferase family protein [Brucella intermedia]